MQNSFKMSGQKWSETEIAELILEMKHGKSIQEISENHNRSAIAIQLRMASIIEGKLKSKQKKQVANELNLNINSIDNILTNSQNYTKNKNNTPSTTDHHSEKLKEIEVKLNNIEKYCKVILKKLK